MKRRSRPVTVFVALDKSLVSRTKKLAGIFRAMARVPHVDMQLMDEGRALTPALVDKAVASGTGAFIIGASGVDAAMSRINGLGLPCVTISQPYRLHGRACSVRTDNRKVATEAMRLFSESPVIASFAYYPAAGDPEWSRARGRHFLELAAKRRDRTASILPRNGTAEKLAKLPKPVAVLAANDTYGAEFLGICRRQGLKVPDDVAVISVDNEEFLCESATPPLTSIQPDFEREGFEAANAVVGLLDGRSVPERIECGTLRTVVRRSTDEKDYAAGIVGRALSYINANATSGATVEDVCASLNVSRRLLDIYFKSVKGIPPREALVEARLAALKKALRNSDLPIAAVCRKCGFGSENHPKKLFRARFGMTMRDFRKMT